MLFQDFDSDNPRADDFCGLLITKLLGKNSFPLKRIRLVNSLSMMLSWAIVKLHLLGGERVDSAPTPRLAGFSR